MPPVTKTPAGGRVGAAGRNSSLANALAASGAQGFAGGGLVFPNVADDVVATLQAGEFVLQRDAVGRVGLDKLQQVNQGAAPEQVFGQPNIDVHINAPATGIPLVDALQQFVVNQMAVSITTPGSQVRQAQARGTLPGAVPVRGRS